MGCYFYLYVKTTGIASFVGLNDVQIIKDPEAEGIITDEPVNQWLKPQKNQLNIFLSWPTDKQFTPNQAKAEVKLYIADPTSDVPKPGEVLASFNWPNPGEPEAYPYTLEETVEIKTPPEMKLWTEGKPISEISEADKAVIIDLVEQLRKALLAKDTNLAFSLLQYRYTEEAMSEEKNPDQVRAAIIEQYNWLMGLGDLSTQPLTTQEASFTIVGDGHLVQINRGEHDPAVILEHQASNRCFAIPIYVAQINNKWTIVR